MNAYNVLPIGDDETEYRCAITTIISDIQRERGVTFVDIAEVLDCSVKTVENAFHQRTNLSPIYLKRLGKGYGATFLNPFLATFDAQAAPRDAATKDIMPLLTGAAHELACARDPAGPGGIIEVPQEKAACLKPFKALHRELSGQIAHIEAVLA